ncbi:Flp pilus assembly protein CpaB [Hyphomonas chukchiensis]|uniref:Flp pilus assembly protein CpaB n=1 Tax=Hyphomonas chukchiensis TaxID=1280947 RepID=UPI0030FB0DF6
MKATTLISLGLSLVLGVGAVFLGRSYMTSDKNEASAASVMPAVEMSSVIVATSVIETGDLIDHSTLKATPWPADAVPADAVRSLEDIKDVAYARGLIVPGEPLMRTKIDETGSVLTLAAAIAPGMRAVAVVVGSDTGVAGFVLPGDRVDVNEFVPRDEASGGRAHDGERMSGNVIARSVIKNVKVLAIDQTFDEGLEGALPSNTVTLEVSPDDALMLGAASQRGALGLALIGRKEEAEVVAEIRKAPVPVSRTRIVRAPSTARIRVINGDAETEVTTPVAAPKAPAGGASQ